MTIAKPSWLGAHPCPASTLEDHIAEAMNGGFRWVLCHKMSPLATMQISHVPSMFSPIPPKYHSFWAQLRSEGWWPCNSQTCSPKPEVSPGELWGTCRTGDQVQTENGKREASQFRMVATRSNNLQIPKHVVRMPQSWTKKASQSLSCMQASRCARAKESLPWLIKCRHLRCLCKIVYVLGQESRRKNRISGMHKVGVWSGSFLIAPKFRLAPTFGGSLAFFGPWNAQRAMLTSQVDMTCQCLSGSFIKQLKLVWLFHALSLGEHCGMWINVLQNPWLFSPNVTNTYFKNLASVCSCALLHPWKYHPISSNIIIHDH